MMSKLIIGLYLWLTKSPWLKSPLLNRVKTEFFTRSAVQIKASQCESQRGFTLVEVIAVIVILGIIGSIGSQFVVTSMDAYHTTDIRLRLKQRAGLTVEQMTRELQMALPNSLRVSSSSSCIEFLPVVAGARYLNPVPTAENGQSATSAISTASFSLGFGTAAYAAIAPFYPSEVYTTSQPSAMHALGTLGAGPYTSVPLSSGHIFNRNSRNQRLFIVDSPVRFCISGTDIMRYSNYGLVTSALTDGDPGGNSALMSQEVTSIGSAFALSPGAEDVNSKVLINLRFTKDGQSVAIQHQIGIKNVP